MRRLSGVHRFLMTDRGPHVCCYLYSCSVDQSYSYLAGLNAGLELFPLPSLPQQNLYAMVGRV